MAVLFPEESEKVENYSVCVSNPSVVSRDEGKMVLSAIE